MVLIIMVESTKKAKTEQATKRPVGRPPKARSNFEKVEEVRLGKFSEQKPLRLPEKQIRRGWQIAWAIVLIVMAMMGVCAILLTDPVAVLTWDNDGFAGGRIGSLGLYWMVMEVMILVATICCVVASVMMFAKKRVPAGLWYALIGAVAIGLICASFHKFNGYEERLCYENYPGEDRGSGCPSVVGSLSMIVIVDLVVLLAGVIGMRLVGRKKRGRSKKVGRR